jgi:mannitol/fructose-specific phosphotransferase system IIA component (Ntr-type)
MLPAELIAHCGVITGCQHFTKQQLIEQMLLQLAIQGYIPVAELPAISAAVMRRETLGSTGVGGGIAMPHTRHASVQRTSVSAFLFRPPVQFDSLDGEPVDMFFLFLSPPPEPHERLISDRFSGLHRQLARDEFRTQFRQCETGDDIRRVLCAPDTDDWES